MTKPDQLKTIVLDRVSDLFAGIGQRLEQMNAECVKQLEIVQQIRERAAETIDAMDQFKPVIELIISLNGTIEQHAENVDEVCGGLVELADELVEHAEVTIADSVTEFTDAIDEGIGNFESELTEQTDSMVERTNQLVEEMREQRRAVSELLQTVLGQNFEETLKNNANPFLEKLDALRNQGTSRLRQLREMCEQVQETMQTLTDLVERARPVLDLMEQAL